MDKAYNYTVTYNIATHLMMIILLFGILKGQIFCSRSSIETWLLATSLSTITVAVKYPILGCLEISVTQAARCMNKRPRQVMNSSIFFSLKYFKSSLFT